MGTAIITGAAKGLGLVIADLAAAHGYDLVIDARTRSALDAAAQSLRSNGRTVVPIAGDIADADHRDALVAAATELGDVSLLVNNASELGGSPPPAIADLDADTLRRILEVNIVAPLALTRSLLPHLRKSGRGLIVDITSDAAAGAYPGWGGYGASKAALELATRTIAAEEDEVAAVVVDPGDMATDMHQAAFPGEDISDRPPATATIPFWTWLLGRNPAEIDGRRYRAQSDTFLTAGEAA